jgi:hypothetical protein
MACAQPSRGPTGGVPDTRWQRWGTSMAAALSTTTTLPRCRCSCYPAGRCCNGVDTVGASSCIPSVASHRAAGQPHRHGCRAQRSGASPFRLVSPFAHVRGVHPPPGSHLLSQAMQRLPMDVGHLAAGNVGSTPCRFGTLPDGAGDHYFNSRLIGPAVAGRYRPVPAALE